MATKRRASGIRGKPNTEQRATQRRIDEEYRLRVKAEAAELRELDKLKAEVCAYATGEALEGLQLGINQAISKWLMEHRVEATRVRTAITNDDKRRITAVLLALSIPENQWTTRIAELTDAITAGQSLDDLSQVNLNDVMGAALDTLMKRYVTAQERLTAARLK